MKDVNGLLLLVILILSVLVYIKIWKPYRQKVEYDNFIRNRQKLGYFDGFEYNDQQTDDGLLYSKPDNYPNFPPFIWEKNDPIILKAMQNGNFQLVINEMPAGELINPNTPKANGEWVLVIAGQIPLSCKTFEEALANIYVLATNLIVDQEIETDMSQQLLMVDKLLLCRKFLEELTEKGLQS